MKTNDKKRKFKLFDMNRDGKGVDKDEIDDNDMFKYSEYMKEYPVPFGAMITKKRDRKTNNLQLLIPHNF